MGGHACEDLLCVVETGQRVGATGHDRNGTDDGFVGHVGWGGLQPPGRPLMGILLPPAVPTHLQTGTRYVPLRAVSAAGSEVLASTDIPHFAAGKARALNWSAKDFGSQGLFCQVRRYLRRPVIKLVRNCPPESPS